MKKKLLLSVISSCATLLVIFLVGEVYLRNKRKTLNYEGIPAAFDIEFLSGRGEKLSPQPGPLHLVIHPYLVYANAPSQRTNDFVINSHGFRNEEGFENDPRPKIAILGGSAAFGMGVKDADTLSSYFDREIPTHRTLNAGVVGYLSGQELSLFATAVADYKPDLVIAYDGWNDLYDPLYGPPVRYPNEMGINATFLQFQERLVESQQSKNQLGPSVTQLLDAISAQSLVFQWVARRFESRVPKALGCQPSTVGTASRTARNQELLGFAVDAYIRNLTKLSKASNAYGAEFIVVIQPELSAKLSRTESETASLNNQLWSCYRNEFPELYKQFVATTKSRLRQAGIQYIDLTQTAPFLDGKETLFFDAVHTTELGNEKVVSIILPEVRNLLAKHQAKAAKPVN